MSDPVIPDIVHRLILERIDSVAQLEALLLLRSEPQDWDAARVAGRLYVSSGEAALLLSSLQARGLFNMNGESGVYRYEPATPELAEAVDLLAETYRTRLIPMTKLIHSKSSSTSSVQRFADAFRLRKEN